jgi:aspartate 1-decarboxylase
MQIRLLKSKLHRVTVTRTRIDYDGSITIDRDLMDAADIYPYEQVLVANLANGTRHETYVVPGDRGSGAIEILGAAAHLVSKGDKVIIMAFADIEKERIPEHKPKIVLVDDQNRIRKIKSD